MLLKLHDAPINEKIQLFEAIFFLSQKFLNDPKHNDVSLSDTFNVNIKI